MNFLTWQEAIDAVSRPSVARDCQRGEPQPPMLDSTPTRCGCGRLAPLTGGRCWPCRERYERSLLRDMWMQDESGPRREVALLEADVERAKRVRAGVSQ